MSHARVVILLFVSQCYAVGADLERVFRLGTPITNRQVAWPGHVDFASWVDEDQIAYWQHGDLACHSIATNEVEWTIPRVGELRRWSFSRATKRLAIMDGDGYCRVIDCGNGAVLFAAGRPQMATLLGVDRANFYNLALAPDDGRLIVCLSAKLYGRHAYLLDPSYTRVLASFDIDPYSRELTCSPDGGRLAVVTDGDVLCVRDLQQQREIFRQGKRIQDESDAPGYMTDMPFFSHIQDGGADELVYTRDGGWGNGEASVYNSKTQQTRSFDARNGHIELAVSFPTRRIALTGDQRSLTIVDFEGNVIASKDKAATQRVRAIDFSPSGERILLGSWDNTLSVYRLVE